MSGGSLNYAFSNVETLAEEIKYRSRKPLHLAFAKHLEKVAKALHDIEWLFSGDYGDGQEEEAIRAVLAPQDELNAAREKAEEALGDLRVALAWVHDRRVA